METVDVFTGVGYGRVLLDGVHTEFGMESGDVFTAESVSLLWLCCTVFLLVCFLTFLTCSNCKIRKSLPYFICMYYNLQ